MGDQFKLIYRGEVHEGQHAAVVRKRLCELLKLDGARGERLFSGEPVVLKKSVDEHTAARFQAAFKKAGAVLRVVRVQADPAEPAGGSEQEGGLSVLPVGSDVLSEGERSHHTQRDIDTSHLELLSGAPVPAEEEELLPPDVSHLELAEVGSRLGPTSDSTPVPELDVSFDLAAVGEDIGESRASAAPFVSVDPQFDLAEPGARLGSEDDQPPPAAPDTSHMTLKEEEDHK